MSTYCGTGSFTREDGSSVEGTIDGINGDKLKVNTKDGLIEITPGQIEEVSGRFTVFGLPMRFRIDAFSTLVGSGSSTLARLSATLFDGPLEHFGMSVETRSRMLVGEMQAEGQQWLMHHMRNAVVEAKVPLKERFAFEVKFQEEVAAVARGDTRAIENASTHVTKAAKAYSDAMYKMAAELESKGIVDKGVLTSRANHVTRSWNDNKALHFERRFGKEAFLNVIAGAIRSRDVTMTMDDSLVVANVIRTTLRSKDTADLLGSASVFGEKALNEAAIKVAQEQNIDESLAKSIVSMMTGEASAFKTGVLQKRVDLDEAYTHTVTDVKTGQQIEVKVSDVFNNNASQLLDGYTKKVAGIIALAERGNLHKEAVFEHHLTKVRDELIDAGKSARFIEERVSMIRDLRKALMGTLDAESGNFARAARLLMSLSFVRFMAQAGFSQTAELSGIYGYAGFGAVNKHVPLVKKLISDMRKGLPVDDEFAKDLRVMGLGMEQISSKFFLKGATEYEGDFLGHTERYMENAKQGVAFVSGLRPANALLQQVAGRSWFQFMWEAASGIKELSPANIQRLEADGLNAQDLLRVKDGLKKYATSKNGVVDHIDTEAWRVADPDGYMAMISTMQMQTRKMFIQAGVAERPFWMSKLGGQLLMQMRGFLVDTYTKSTLNHAKHHDSIALMTMFVGVTLGSMQYALRAYVNNFNNKEERDKKLKARELIVQGINNSSPFSVMPILVDAGLEVSGHKPAFGSRLSDGSAKDFLSGSGALRTLDDIIRGGVVAGKTVVGMGDYTPTKSEVNRSLSLFTPNLFGLRNLQHAITQHLPDKNPEAVDLFDDN